LVSEPIEVEESTLAKDIGTLFTTGMFADVILQVSSTNGSNSDQPQQLKCHKIILSQCKYFAQIFDPLASRMQKTDGIDTVCINDIDFDKLLKVVQFHYGLRVNFKSAGEVWALLKVCKLLGFFMNE
jgi:hypothetical protein